MPRGVQRRIARAVTLLLLGAGLSQLLVALFVIRRETHALREGLLLTGLKLAQSAAAAGTLTNEKLTRAHGDLPGLAVVTYGADGRRLAASRPDVPVLAQLSQSQRQKADATDGAVLLENNDLFHDNVGIMRVPGAGPVRYVGLFDRWAPARVDAALSQGLVGGFVASVLVGTFATLILARRLRRGLRRAEAVVNRMADGELGLRLPSYGQDEVGRLAQSFNHMATQLEWRIGELSHEREARRRAFADWTHELSTPLTSVLGYLESLDTGGLDDETRQRYVATAYRQACALRALSDDLSTLARLDFDGLRLDRGRVDLAALARAEVEGMQGAASGVILGVVGPERGPHVDGDGQRLGQVLRNLLDNAIFYTPPGRSVEVQVSVQGELACLTVVDQGVGIASEHLPHLGERFYRVEAARDRRSGGRGLGLAIARGIVEAHGGRLHIASQPGHGTRVCVELPLIDT